MNPILYIVSLFYHWFNTRNSSKLIAYESAIGTFVIVLFSNFLAILKLSHHDDFFTFSMSDRTKSEYYLIIAIGILFFGFILSIFAPKKKIKSINYDLRDQSVDFTIMFIYSIGSFLSVILLY